MSDGIDLDALRELCDQATPGPWFRHYAWVTTDGPEPMEGDEDERWVAGFARSTITRDPQRIADAEFIAAARSAVPALIAEVERLTVERDRARDVACRLAQENAEALRIAREALIGLGGGTRRRSWTRL